MSCLFVRSITFVMIDGIPNLVLNEVVLLNLKVYAEILHGLPTNIEVAQENTRFWGQN